jgi:hypothetical protein
MRAPAASAANQPADPHTDGIQSNPDPEHDVSQPGSYGEYFARHSDADPVQDLAQPGGIHDRPVLRDRVTER